MSVEPFNMAAETLRSEMAVAPAPSKAKTEMKALMKKVTDTSETIINKAVTVIEHPVEFVKAHGKVDNMSSYVPPVVPPPVPPVFDTHHSSDYDSKTNYNNYQNGGSGFNTAAFTTTTTTSTYNNNTNSTNGTSGGTGGNLFGTTPQKGSDPYQTKNMSNSSTTTVATNGQNRSPDFNSKNNVNINSSSTNVTTKGTNKQQPVVERAPPVLVETESSKAAAAEKWEAELQRVKNEKKWEAEVARIKEDRRMEAEEQERREAEEAQNQENIRQGKLQPQPKHRKKNGEDGGVEVVGNGCTACIVS
eukprot:gene21697-27747_t